MRPEPTYVFENDKVYALVGGKVVAAALSIEDVEDELAQETERTATHIVTPNGLRGQILGKVAGIYSDQVTVRFANGQIRSLAVTDELEFVAEEAEEPANPVVGLRERLEASIDGDRGSLETRLGELVAIKHEARDLLRTGASLADELSLDEIVVQADHETNEINNVIEHLDHEDTLAYEPPAPFKTEVIEQATMGGSDGAWLDHTMNEMVEEAQNTDYEQLMGEGPALLTAELEEPALADAGVVRAMASDFISAKTAGVEDDEAREKYHRTFLTRVERARVEELNRRTTTTTQKEAAQEEPDDFPDDALFM